VKYIAKRILMTLRGKAQGRFFFAVDIAMQVTE
jgi:hypothetical protein